MKVRFIIEHGPSGDLYLGLIDGNGDYVGGPGHKVASVEEAKRDVAVDEPDLTWRMPPTEWMPDAIEVSTYYDDPGWDNR